MQNTISDYQKLINMAVVQNAMGSKNPVELYEPCDYFLKIGGKRIRPVLCLMACDLFGGNIEDAVKPALAIEYFHNFTLIHDDIMDEAPLRRGQPTVHLKYGLNTGILSGDLLFGRSFQLFEDLEPIKYKAVLQLFTKTMIEICEGQQYDKNFETKSDISFSEYIRMIELKTAVLLGTALKTGAVIADATEENQQNIYDFGKNLGLAFQLQDDYLDVFGSPNFGKLHAGDIVENKKTILYIKCVENVSDADLKELNKWYAVKTTDSQKIEAVKAIFERSGSRNVVKELINEYSNKAIYFLDSIKVAEDKKQLLRELTGELIKREI